MSRRSGYRTASISAPMVGEAWPLYVTLDYLKAKAVVTYSDGLEVDIPVPVGTNHVVVNDVSSDVSILGAQFA